MLEALHIHSVLFDILSSMGISESKKPGTFALCGFDCYVLVISVCFYGYKICLVVVPAVILFL